MGLGVLAFVVALIGSIMLHEAGHLLTAKRFGMKATQYFVGFGPTLWSRHRGETEYGVKAIPAGGFVKIVGMTDLEEIDPADAPRAFYRQPAGRRAIVLGAGSFTHFVLGFFLLVLAYGAFALPKGTTTEVDQVSQCVTQEKQKKCAGEPASPARQAGFQPGDVVVAIDGKPVTVWEDFTDVVRAHPASDAVVTVVRNGETRKLTAPIVRLPRKVDGKVVEVGTIGLVPVVEYERLGPVRALEESVSTTGTFFTATGKAIADIPGKVPSAFRKAFLGEKRDLSDLVGPVGVAKFSGQAFGKGRYVEFLEGIAALNVFIGVLNLLPLLPLDGGHLAILGFEQARSRLARLRGRRDPGRVDIRRLLPSAYAVIMFFAGLTLLLLYSDITNPIANPF